MRRRKHISNDSLELLLDTICNIFGGIILMAILVIIQTQASAGRLLMSASLAPDTTLQFSKLRFECALLQQSIQEIEEQKKDLINTYKATASPVTETLLESRGNFSLALEIAIKEDRQLRNILAQSQKEMSDNEDNIDEVTTRILEFRSENEALKKQNKMTEIWNYLKI